MTAIPRFMSKIYFQTIEQNKLLILQCSNAVNSVNNTEKWSILLITACAWVMCTIILKLVNNLWSSLLSCSDTWNLMVYYMRWSKMAVGVARVYNQMCLRIGLIEHGVDRKEEVLCSVSTWMKTTDRLRLFISVLGISWEEQSKGGDKDWIQISRNGEELHRPIYPCTVRAQGASTYASYGCFQDVGRLEIPAELSARLRNAAGEWHTHCVDLLFLNTGNKVMQLLMM